MEPSSLVTNNTETSEYQESVEKDYINPQGVRFTQQNGREGRLH